MKRAFTFIESLTGSLEENEENDYRLIEILEQLRDEVNFKLAIIKEDVKYNENKKRVLTRGSEVLKTIANNKKITILNLIDNNTGEFIPLDEIKMNSIYEFIFHVEV
jgi:hypothetical protein